MDASLRLRSAQHDSLGIVNVMRCIQHEHVHVIPNAVSNPVHGCFAPLSMTNWELSMMRCIQHEHVCGISSKSEESSVGSPENAYGK